MAEADTIMERLQNVRRVYERIDEMFDTLHDFLQEILPEQFTQNSSWFWKLKDMIFKNQDLKNLMNGINNNRPPRLFLIGRTGVGKSSLINAICGCYVAKVSDTRSCTKDITIHRCEIDD